MSVQVRNLTHIYAEGLPWQSVALDSVSFDVNDGEFVGIIGPTGSGKTTLARHLNGLLKPTGGSVVVGGIDIAKEKTAARDVRRKVGLVFQYPESQLFEETVYKDVAFGPANLGLSKEEIDERVREALERVGLAYEEVARRSPFDLSGGQKRRVAIAGVVAMKPELLILDEPTAGLDPKSQKEILNMLRGLHESHGRKGGGTILISHNMSDIARFSDKVLVMNRGKLILSGTPREVFRQEELLVSIGLAPVPAAAFMRRLCLAGFPARTDVLTVAEAVDEIVAALGKPAGGAE